MKHAYLILAHADFIILEKLVRALDDERNDIFIHFDLKVKNLPSVQTEHAGLFILKDRVNVRWGDLSVVEAEYKLFEAAAARDVYTYYHLLSGVDMPLKSQDDIHEFFRVHQGKEFIGFSTYDYIEEVRRKVNRWHLFPHDFKNQSMIKRVLRASFVRSQELLNIQRNRKVEFRKGTQWVSITDGLVRHLITAKPWVMKTFTHTFCPDEIYKHTLCWSSEYRQNIYSLDNEADGCLRAIGWKDNTIKEWKSADYDTLMKSGRIFARKFSSKDIQIVDRILNTIK